MMPARLWTPSSFSRHRCRHSICFALIHCLQIRLDRLASDEVQDVSLRRVARSRKEPSCITTRAVLKSATSGKPLASPRPAVTAKSLAVNKLLLIGRKLKSFFPTPGNFVAKVSMYNPDTDSYRLFYTSDV